MNTTEVYLMDDKLNDVVIIRELTTCLKIPKSHPHLKNSWHWRFRKGAIDIRLAETRFSMPS